MSFVPFSTRTEPQTVNSWSSLRATTIDYFVSILNVARFDFAGL